MTGTPEDPGEALARHLMDQPVSVLQRAFRHLGLSITFHVTELDPDKETTA